MYVSVHWYRYAQASFFPLLFCCLLVSPSFFDYQLAFLAEKKEIGR